MSEITEGTRVRITEDAEELDLPLADGVLPGMEGVVLACLDVGEDDEAGNDLWNVELPECPFLYAQIYTDQLEAIT